MRLSVLEQLYSSSNLLDLLPRLKPLSFLRFITGDFARLQVKLLLRANQWEAILYCRLLRWSGLLDGLQSCCVTLHQSDHVHTYTGSWHWTSTFMHRAT